MAHNQQQCSAGNCTQLRLACRFFCSNHRRNSYSQYDRQINHWINPKSECKKLCENLKVYYYSWIVCKVCVEFEKFFVRCFYVPLIRTEMITQTQAGSFVFNVPRKPTRCFVPTIQSVNSFVIPTPLYHRIISLSWTKNNVQLWLLYVNLVGFFQFRHFYIQRPHARRVNCEMFFIMHSHFDENHFWKSARCAKFQIFFIIHN